MEYYSQVVLFASIASAALLTGGGIALVNKPGVQLRSAILHFAAGVIFSVVAVELIPDIMAKHDIFEIALGFGAGVLLMLAIRYFFEPGKEQKNRSGFPVAFIAIIGVDLLIDGILMGIGFVTSQETGVLLAVALSVELLSLGMATATTLSASRVSRKKNNAVHRWVCYSCIYQHAIECSIVSRSISRYVRDHPVFWISCFIISCYGGTARGSPRKQRRSVVDGRFLCGILIVYAAAGWMLTGYQISPPGRN